MSLTESFDSECRRALELAKSWLPANSRLDIATLLRALYHGTHLHEREELKELADDLPVPTPTPTQGAAQVYVTDELAAVLRSLPRSTPVTPEQLFAILS